MSRAMTRLPVYTGDVSGAASALYELGGMVVIHDPSGCNSTYNTHDELRWYDKESLIFISGLNDRDARDGNDAPLVADVVEAARHYAPAFVAIANSPVPYLIGTDFAAICREVEAACGIPCFHVATNAMHDYVRGAGLALTSLAEKLLPPSGSTWDGAGGDRATRPLRVGVLGMTPLDFAARGSAASLRRTLEGAGFEVVATATMDCALDEFMRLPGCDAMLVVSSCGLGLAHLLERRYGIPYVTGVPTGALTGAVLGQLREAAGGGASCAEVRPAYLAPSVYDAQSDVVAIGEPVTMGSLGAAYALAHGCRFRLVATTEDAGGAIAAGEAGVRDEDEVLDALGTARVVLGDPLYRDVCPRGVAFVEVPHVAFSGRLYLDRVHDWTRDG